MRPPAQENTFYKKLLNDLGVKYDCNDAGVIKYGRVLSDKSGKGLNLYFNHRKTKQSYFTLHKGAYGNYDWQQHWTDIRDTFGDRRLDEGYLYLIPKFGKEKAAISSLLDYFALH